MIECENCGTTLTFPAMLRLWKEYRVGAADSPDRFYLCPTCDDDPAVDPIETFANNATVTDITPA